MNAYVSLILLILFGIVIGFGLGYLMNIYKTKQLGKMAEKDLKKDDLVDEELKPCLICGKNTTGDVCGLKHQKEWVKNHTRLSEGNHEPNKVGELINKGSSNELAPTP